MGLDMYLFARGGVNADTGERIEDDEIGYWRNFNALHGLFLQIGNADADLNNDKIALTLADLEYIYSICREVGEILDKAQKYSYFDKIENTAIVNDNYYFDQETEDAVRDLMSPREGFFWGTTCIDFRYHFEVTRTLPILERAIELAKQGEEIYYYCWW